MKELELALSRAKARMILHQPFYASLVCAMPLEITTALPIPTAATNGKRIKVHPDFIRECSLDEMVFVLAHEVSHIALKHVFRRGTRNKHKWNAACDIVINQLLVDAKIGKMPEGGLLNTALCQKANYSADRVYDLLPDNPNDGMGWGSGEAWDDVEDAPGDEAAQRAAEAEVKVMVSQAMAVAEGRGKMPAGVRDLVKEILAPSVPWEDELREFAAVRLQDESTWSRPSRRFMSQDLIMPARTGEALGEMMVAYDKSGSVNARTEARFNAEIIKIHGDLRPAKLHVVFFTGQVDEVRSFGPDDKLDLDCRVTGITRFSPIFRRAEKEAWDLQCAVVLTDLVCSDYGLAPPYPVLWASTLRKDAPWGRVLAVKA
jgi:predicted metal-dependent peptidase